MPGRAPKPSLTRCAALAVFLAVFGCDRGPASQQTTAQQTAAQPAAADLAVADPAGRRSLSTITAFELVASEHPGAVLGWIDAGAALHVLRLDRDGGVQSQVAQTLAAARVADLTLVDTAGGLSAVWREEVDDAARARGWWWEPAGNGRPLELGAAWGGARAERGNISLAARGAEALALVRGPRHVCDEDVDAGCFGFGFHRLSASGASETSLDLRVPVPCDSHAAQLLVAQPGPGAVAAVEPAFHYAVCTHADESSLLTVFSIEAARSYAAAHRVLGGCTPLGAGYFGGRPLFVAECPRSRRAARLHDADREPEILNLDVGLACGPRGARLRLDNDWLDLERPTSRLELFLDDALSPRGARAAWTGAVLLVAHPTGGELRLDRYGCAEGELRRLSSPLD